MAAAFFPAAPRIPCRGLSASARKGNSAKQRKKNDAQHYKLGHPGAVGFQPAGPAAQALSRAYFDALAPSIAPSINAVQAPVKNLLRQHTCFPAGSLVGGPSRAVLGTGFNISAITDDLNSADNRTFGYDAIHRLTSANGPWGAGSYTYDANGNRLSKTLGASNTAYAYTTGTNKLASATGSEPGSYGYDTNGNTTGDGTHTYGYSQQPPGERRHGGHGDLRLRDRKSTRLNSSHTDISRMPSSA